MIGAGVFVRFGDEGFEGFLPARKLRGEWWSLNEEGTALVGEESGRALRMGDPVRVEVAKVFAPRGRVDLLPDNGLPCPTSRATSRPPTASTCSTSGSAASSSRARRSSRSATAACSSRTPTRRSPTARSGCTTCTSPRTSTRRATAHEPERPRKLLMHKREIERLIGKIQQKGLTLVPTRIYFKGPYAKVELALGKGKDHARQAPRPEGEGPEARDRARAARAVSFFRAATATPSSRPS